MVCSMLLRDAVSALPAAHAVSGALFLAAREQFSSNGPTVCRLGGKLFVSGAPVPRRLPHEHPASFAERVWDRSDVVVADDPAEWVSYDRLGSRVIARGASVLWGVEISAEPEIPLAMLRDVVRMAHRGSLQPGVLYNGASTAFLEHSRSRWFVSHTRLAPPVIDNVDAALEWLVASTGATSAHHVANQHHNGWDVLAVLDLGSVVAEVELTISHAGGVTLLRPRTASSTAGTTHAAWEPVEAHHMHRSCIRAALREKY
jgi:hypothetical protein